MVEDESDIFPGSLEQLQAAIYRLGKPTGPTFLNLKEKVIKPKGSKGQA